MDRKISIIGLGYVGLPVAVAFGKKRQVIAFDINQKRINELKNDLDHTREISVEELTSSHLLLTSNPADLKKADFHIVAVPTPIDEAKQPDLRPILSASKNVAKIFLLAIRQKELIRAIKSIRLPRSEKLFRGKRQKY